MDPESLSVLQVPVFARLDEYVGVWAIDETRAAAMWRMVQGMDLRMHMEQPTPKAKSTADQVDVPGGKKIAVINARGALMKQQSSLGYGTSTVQMRKDLRAAANDPEVGAVLLSIDSPGGTVAGMEDLATEVKATRGKKPVYAQIEDLGASAAYWLAAGAEKIFAGSKSAMVGSIGTMMTLYDTSKAAEQQGVKAIVFRTGPIKGAGIDGDPITPEQQAHFQDLIEQSQKIFDDAVQNGRGMTSAQLANVRTGGVWLAEEAQKRGLIDGIQSQEKTLSALVGLIQRSPQGGKVAMNDFEKYLSARGLKEADLSAEQLATFKADYEASTKKADPVVIEGGAVSAAIQKEREAQSAEILRCEQIREVAANHPKIVAEAIREGWTTGAAALACKRADLSAGPHFVIGSVARDQGPEVMQAALCLTGRLQGAEKHFSAQTLEAAHKHFRGFGLKAMIVTAARRNGWNGEPMSAFAQGNVKGVLQAAFSTQDLPVTLSNTAQKFAVQGLGQIEQVYRKIAKIRTVTDFKPSTGIRPTGGGEFEKVGPTGRIKHGKLGEATYANQAETFAKMLAIPYQSLRNDDLGFLDDADTLLGRGAGRAINRAFWTEFMNNASFFSSGNGNYASGTGTALSDASLGTAEGMFAAQTNEDGDALGFEARYLLVPSALSVTARKLYQSQNVNTGGSSTTDVVPNSNVWAGKYEPLVSQFLSNVGITGYSMTAWYLIADPADAPVEEVVFLDGQEEPIVETADVDFDQLGIQMRGVLHFGVKKVEYRGGLKMKGAA